MCRMDSLLDCEGPPLTFIVRMVLAPLFSSVELELRSTNRGTKTHRATALSKQ